MTELYPGVSVKDIRRVRTPEGVEHFGQPIGSIIVADIPTTRPPKRRTTAANRKPEPKPIDLEAMIIDDESGRSRSQQLQRMESEYPGWKKWGYKKKVFYSVREEDGTWVVTDKDDNVLHEGPTEGEAIRELESDLGFPERQKTAAMSHMHPLRDAEEKKAVEEHFGVKIPPGLGQIHVADIGSEQANAFAGIKMDGAWRVFPSKAATEEGAAEKWERLRRLKPHIGKLDEAIDSAPMDDQAALVVMLMRLTGMRVGTSRKQQGAKQAYGASTLQARHVTFNQNSVTFNFIGKEGVKQSINVKDPDFVERVKIAMEGKSRQDWLTPDVKASDTIKFLRDATGSGEMKNHDLRTYLANVMAVELLNGFKKRKKPKNKTEYKRMVNEIGDAVAKQLGNNRSATLKSYINPAVFLPFAEEGWL